eukprot:5351961-Lingulodinium_polyedra.AAC.1
MEESDRVVSYLKSDWRARWVSELRALHYHVVWQIVNAKHHGVPQDRPRFWVVGIRQDTPGKH